MARTFNGTSDKVVWGTSSSYDLTSWTATAWVKFPSNSSAEHQIFTKQTVTFLGRLYLLQFPGLQNSIATVATKNAGSGTAMAAWSVADTMTAGVWNFVASSYDGGTTDTNVHVYHSLHGSLATEVSYASRDAGSVDTLDNGTNLMIGSREPLDTFWSGEIADVRLYDTILNISQIQSTQFGGYPTEPVFRAPLWGIHSPEISWGSAGRPTGTLTGTTQSDNPPVTTFTTKAYSFLAVEAAPAADVLMAQICM